MGLKLFVFKMILIFNFVAVYSISCKKLSQQGDHKIGKFNFVIKQVGNIEDEGKKVRYVEAYFVDPDIYQTEGLRIMVNSCVSNEDNRYLLQYTSSGGSIKYLDITSF